MAHFLNVFMDNALCHVEVSRVLSHESLRKGEYTVFMCGSAARTLILDGA